MNKSGHIKGQESEEETNIRQFLINCFGPNDQRKYFSITPFGIDYNAPINTRSLVTDSANKDINYNLGVLNKLKIDDLNPGESSIFSTNEDGSEIVSKIVLRNTGAVEINKDLDGVQILINADGSLGIITTGNAVIDVDGDVSLTASGNINASATQFNVNSGNLTVD